MLKSIFSFKVLGLILGSLCGDLLNSYFVYRAVDEHAYGLAAGIAMFVILLELDSVRREVKFYGRLSISALASK